LTLSPCLSPYFQATLRAVPETVEIKQIQGPPKRVWDRILAQPDRVFEVIALAGAERFGPQAAEWVRIAGAGHSPEKLARIAYRKHVRMARLEGGALGIGGAITAAPDLVALIWIQTRMVFYIAAAYGYDPADPMRPAELLVLYDFYPDPHSARRALDGIGDTIVESYIGSKLERDEALALRLAKLLGVRSARRLAGRLVPGFAIAWNAIGNERRTRGLADNAIRFYGGS
jgi:EcsC family protein